MITTDQFKKLNPNCKSVELYVQHLNKYMPMFGITTPIQQAFFLAQAGHESAGFTKLVENLNYTTPERLVVIFPKYFPNKKIAEAYAGKPEKIANVVYANRMGNGDASSGDGWKYRGKGIIQITGKTAQIRAMLECDLASVDALMEIEGAIKGACWWWKTNNMNRHSDKNDINASTKAVNGGYNGLDDRIVRLAGYKKVLGA